MRLLITKNANTKEKDNEGLSAMHLVTRHKSPRCLALLMSKLEPGEIDDQDNSKVSAAAWRHPVSRRPCDART